MPLTPAPMTKILFLLFNAIFVFPENKMSYKQSFVLVLLYLNIVIYI